MDQDFSSDELSIRFAEQQWNKFEEKIKLWKENHAGQKLFKLEESMFIDDGILFDLIHNNFKQDQIFKILNTYNIVTEDLYLSVEHGETINKYTISAAGTEKEVKKIANILIGVNFKSTVVFLKKLFVQVFRLIATKVKNALKVG